MSGEDADSMTAIPVLALACTLGLGYSQLGRPQWHSSQIERNSSKGSTGGRYYEDETESLGW